MSEICADKVQCGTLEQSVSPCGAGYTGSLVCEPKQPTTLPVTGGGDLWLFLLGAMVVYAIYRSSKKLDSCPRCGGELDYEHSGYNGLRPYCHKCKRYK